MAQNDSTVPPSSPESIVSQPPKTVCTHENTALSRAQLNTHFLCPFTFAIVYCGRLLCYRQYYEHDRETCLLSKEYFWIISQQKMHIIVLSMSVCVCHCRNPNTPIA